MSYNASASLFYGIIYDFNSKKKGDIYQKIYDLIDEAGYQPVSFGCFAIQSDDLVGIALKQCSISEGYTNIDLNEMMKISEEEINKFKTFLIKKLKVKEPEIKWYLSSDYS